MRKYATFEHVYSIATVPGIRTPSTFPETGSTTTKNRVVGASVTPEPMRRSAETSEPSALLMRYWYFCSHHSKER